jgi:O-antigen ligase
VATLASPATLGAFIGMGIVLALSVLVWAGPVRLRRLAFATILAGFPGLFFTYTRGPMLATIIAASFVLASRTGTRLFAFGLLLVTVAVVAIFWGRITSSTVYRDRLTQANTVQIRTELERWSLKLARERPVFGWGYGSFDRVVSETDLGTGNLSRSKVVTSTSHNTFLTILVELGSVGFALFALPWLLIIWRALVGARRSPEARWLLLGAVGALGVYAFAASAVDFRFFSFVPAVAWMLLGILRRHERALDLA